MLKFKYSVRNGEERISGALENGHRMKGDCQGSNYLWCHELSLKGKYIWKQGVRNSAPSKCINDCCGLIIKMPERKI